MGGGMGGMGMGGGGMGMGGGGMGGGGGGGFFNIPAEKVGQFKVQTVCLEHGKKDPRPAIPYEIKPIERSPAGRRRKSFARCWAWGRSTSALPRPRPGI